MSVNTLADENKRNSVVNVVYAVTDQSKTNSMASINMVTDEDKTNFSANVKMVVEKKTNSTVSVNTMAVNTCW